MRTGGPKLRGGRACLDFVNTVDPRRGDDPREYLGDYRDLVAWGRHAGLLEEGEARPLLAEAARRPAEAVAAFARALDLRETMYRVFFALSRGERPDGRDVEALGEAYVGAMRYARLTPSSEGFGWTWTGRPVALGRPLWPVARSAVELLTSGDLGRVKECPASDGCGWLFYDSSKNASRRWCSMEVCGSRDKMRRLYSRKRAGRPEAGGAN